MYTKLQRQPRMVISKNLIWIWNFPSTHFSYLLSSFQARKDNLSTLESLLFSIHSIWVSTSDPIVSYSRFWLDGNCNCGKNLEPSSLFLLLLLLLLLLEPLWMLIHCSTIQLMLLILIFMLIKLSWNQNESEYIWMNKFLFIYWRAYVVEVMNGRTQDSFLVLKF